eukprot:g60853.t1
MSEGLNTKYQCGQKNSACSAQSMAITTQYFLCTYSSFWYEDFSKHITFLIFLSVTMSPINFVHDLYGTSQQNYMSPSR